MHNIRYKNEALEDFKESIIWYRENSNSAAEAFYVEVKAAIKMVRKNPTQFQNKYKNFYEVFLNKYPFTIVYTIEENTIVIFSIFHQKRNPKKKYR